MKYYIGNYKEDSEINGHRGWLVGRFMEDGPQRVDAVEVKYWELEPGITNHGIKVSKTFECTFIMDGEATASIDDMEVVLSGGQYVVIPPGIKNDLQRIITRKIRALTIKAPSDPTAKIIVSQ